MVRDRLALKWLTSYRLNALRTTGYSLLHPCTATCPVLVLGCQRSGTTMLANVIGLSPLVKDYGEGDPRYFYWDGAPRLRPLEEVSAQLAQERSRFTLLKPLCESQRAGEMLERFPSAKAVWIFRHYHDCVASHVRYYRQFHNGLEYVREMLQLDTPCWKNENLPDGVIDFFATFMGRPLNLSTAYALYWLARNSLVERLPAKAQVHLVSFERVLAASAETLAVVFNHLSIPFRERYSSIVSEPVSKHIKSPPSEIDGEVVERCEGLLDRLRSFESATSLAVSTDESATPQNRNAPIVRWTDAAGCSS